MPTPSEPWNGLRPDVKSYFHSLIISHGKVEFIVHDHSGSFAEEFFKIKDSREIVSLNDLSTIEEDIRYTLKKFAQE